MALSGIIAEGAGKGEGQARKAGKGQYSKGGVYSLNCTLAAFRIRLQCSLRQAVRSAAAAQLN